MAQPQFAWTERFSRRLHLPLWGGALVYAALLSVEFPVIYLAAGAWTLFVAHDGYFVLALLPVSVFFFVLSAYIGRLMSSLEAHALSMATDVDAVEGRLSRLTNLPIALTVGVVFSVFLSIPFFQVDSKLLPFASSVVVSFVPWAFSLVVVGTGLWMWAYSMVAIYRIGKLPMNLKPFTKDRSLGLGFFASTSMRLTAIYYLYISVQLLVDFSSFGFAVSVFARDAALIALGLLLFLATLLGLRRKLLQAKKAESDWIANRYTQVMERIRSSPDAAFDQTTHQELLSIDKIQKDVHSIHSWPFDTGILVRILAIMLSLAAILLSAVVRDLFHF